MTTPAKDIHDRDQLIASARNLAGACVAFYKESLTGMDKKAALTLTGNYLFAILNGVFRKREDEDS